MDLTFGRIHQDFYNTKNGNDPRAFHVLDELDNESDSDDSQYYDSDVPDEEVEKMLEEALAKRKRKAGEAGLGKNIHAGIKFLQSGFYT